jgi:hypothetical protein
MTSPDDVMARLRAGASALQRQHDHVVAFIDLEPDGSLALSLLYLLQSVHAAAALDISSSKVISLC